MSHLSRFGRKKVIVIEPTPPAKCDLCGKHDELRPYGPNGENICYGCGMKDPAMTTRRMEHVLFGEPLDG